MKKNVLLMLVILLFSFKSNGQIKKGNWLVGGNARFSSQDLNVNSIHATGVDFNLSSNIGYFFVDKFAGGIKFSLMYDKVKYNGVISKTTQLAGGPFLRYYFLNAEKRINLFAESAYQYSHNWGNNAVPENQNMFTFSAGPVIYFNSSVGIEFTVNYELYSNSGNKTDAKTFSLGIGFQIHLEKDKEQ